MPTGWLLETTKITSMIAQRRFVEICTTPRWKYLLFGLLVAPPKPSEALRIFHNKNTDDRSLIWLTEPNKCGFPLDGFAIDRHLTFYFARLKANIYTNSTKKLELMNASNSTNLFTNSYDHISTNGKATLHSHISHNNPQFLYSLWRRVTLETSVF